jgi:hypothetical protein
MFPNVVDGDDGSAVFGTLRTMSVDCVPTNRGSSGRGAACPTGTFLQGFKRVNRASASGGRYYFYPKDGGECCKVKFVLPSGNAIGVDGCDCAEEEGYDVSCGQTNEPEAVRKNGAVIGGFDSVIDAMGALGITDARAVDAVDVLPGVRSRGCGTAAIERQVFALELL